jgi:hypothetical protein
MDPYVPPRRRNRRWIGLPVALAVSAAVYLVGHGGFGSTSASVGAPFNAQVAHAAAVKLETDCTEANLPGCLEKEPSGARPVQLSWGGSGDVSIQQYVAAYYDDSSVSESIETQELQTAGVRQIVHEQWEIPGQGQPTADVIVMSFASAQGAQSRALAGAGAALSAQGSDGLQVAIPGLPGYVYPHRAPDASGFVNAEYFTAVGNLLMVVHFGSLTGFDRSDFAAWALGGYLTLRTARIPAAPVTTIGSATTACSPLTSCLVSVPASDSALTDGWGGNSAPSLGQYVQEMYSTSYASTATAGLVNQGVTGVAHTLWDDSAGESVDVVLLRFKTEQGAESRAREEIAAASGSKFSVSGPGSGEGAYTTTADSEGRYPVNVYGSVGDVAVEVYAFTGRPKDPSEATSAAQRQFAKLAAVTKTSTVPQPALVVPTAAPSTLGGTSSCADALSCLVAMPSGASALSGSTYDDSPQVTVAQFVADKYTQQSGAYQSYESGLLTSGGVRQVVHRGWIGADGDQADVAVLVFANAAQAESDAMNYQGAISGSGRLFSVAGYPDAVGSVDTTLDNLGNVHAEIVAYTANFEVRMDYYSLGNFGAQDAISWFDAQLAELPRS